LKAISVPNVIITGHQAFFTREAVEMSRATTIKNITDFEQDRPSGNEIAGHTTGAGYVRAALDLPRNG